MSAAARRRSKSKPPRPARKARAARPGGRTQSAPANTGSLSVEEIDDLRVELARLQSAAGPSRWNAEPDEVRKSVGKLVLTLVEFLRRVLERQAIRRHENGTLTPAEAEAVGTALMRLEETIADMARTFGLDPRELNLDLGPLGRLY